MYSTNSTGSFTQNRNSRHVCLSSRSRRGHCTRSTGDSTLQSTQDQVYTLHNYHGYSVQLCYRYSYHYINSLCVRRYRARRDAVAVGAPPPLREGC
eukprot:COSAG02_NODE_55885_length_288_cov_0.809524_1_plen_95_part_11